MLTIGLHARSDAKISGAAELRQVGSALHVTVTLALPNAVSTHAAGSGQDRTAPCPMWAATSSGMPTRMANGMAMKSGLAGIDRDPERRYAATTADDGSYLFDGQSSGAYAIAVSPPRKLYRRVPGHPPGNARSDDCQCCASIAVAFECGHQQLSPPRPMCARCWWLPTRCPTMMRTTTASSRPSTSAGADLLWLSSLRPAPGAAPTCWRTQPRLLLGDVKNGFLGNAPCA